MELVSSLSPLPRTSNIGKTPISIIKRQFHNMLYPIIVVWKNLIIGTLIYKITTMHFNLLL